MLLKDKLTEDMKTYMRDKNSVALSSIRMIKADIKNAEIDKKSELNDEEVIKLITSSIKKRKDSIDQFKAAGREDLVNKETEELKYLECYLPKQMEKEEIEAIISDELSKLESRDKKFFGIFIKNVMQRVQGKAEGRLVNQMAKEAFDTNV